MANARKINLEVLKAIDSAVVDDVDFQLAVKNRMWRPALTRAAKPWVDVKEYTNKNDGVFIDLVGLTVDGRHNGEAYCLAWVMTVLAYIEFKLQMKSALKATEGCLDLWNSTPDHLKTFDFPQAGYIAIWQHGTSPAGHAGIVLSVHDGYFKTIEANSVGPDGVTQGIFTHERLYSGEGKMKLLGFISPF